jgi:hypothetical protein
MAPASSTVPTIPDVITVQLACKLGPALRQTRKKLATQDREFLWRHVDGGMPVLKALCQNEFSAMKQSNLRAIEEYKDWNVNCELYCQTAKSLSQAQFTMLNDENLEETVRKSWRNYFSYKETIFENGFRLKLFMSS